MQRVQIGRDHDQAPMQVARDLWLQWSDRRWVWSAVALRFEVARQTMERANKNHEILTQREDFVMTDSVYKVIELVGTSSESWEKATANAVALASESLRDLRIAEVSQLDVHIENGQISTYRAKVNVSFKYEGGG